MPDSKESDDPNLGRFTTEDPIRDGLNWYIYANNNPLRFVDPSGLEAEPSDISFDWEAEVDVDIDVNVDVEPIIERAEDLIGTPYGHSYQGESGGTVTVEQPPAMIDCTELISYAYETPLFRTSEFGDNPDFIVVNDEAERGDVIIDTSITPTGDTGHASIFTGENSLLQSDGVGGVRYTTDYVQNYYQNNGYTNIQRTVYRRREENE